MLLTGFDAPPATYLYIDKPMRDHGLFQAVCRVNRLDPKADDKEYGYIVDYKDLFGSLEGAVQDYTGEAFDGYAREDVIGLLEDRLKKGKEVLAERLEQVRALCEPVAPPKATEDFLRYFCTDGSGSAEQLKDNEPKRVSLYKQVAGLVRAYADLANDMAEAGYTESEAAKIKAEVEYYENVRAEVKLASGDYIDLKSYEPAMRQLLGTYIQADASKQVSAFDDLSLMQLIGSKGADFVQALPPELRRSQEAVAETIINNVRRVVIDKSALNPRYYERMSDLLDALIEERRRAAVSYEAFLKRIAELAKQAQEGPKAGEYPAVMNSAARRALYDNLGKDEAAAVKVDEAVRRSLQDEWRSNAIKTKRVRLAIAQVLNDIPPASDAPAEGADERVERILTLVANQRDY
jgi:type I restriction enzyme R subunit